MAHIQRKIVSPQNFPSHSSFGLKVNCIRMHTEQKKQQKNKYYTHIHNYHTYACTSKLYFDFVVYHTDSLGDENNSNIGLRFPYE